SLTVPCSDTLSHLHSFPTRRSSDLHANHAAIMAAGRERRSVSRRRAALRGDHSRRIEEDRGSHRSGGARDRGSPLASATRIFLRSEEHTSELQSRVDLVCRLLLEKK